MSVSGRQVGAIMVREVGDEVLLLDTESNQIHQLNRTASFIWRRLGSAHSPQAIAVGLAAEFDIEEGPALNDVMITLDRLRALNLILDA